MTTTTQPRPTDAELIQILRNAIPPRPKLGAGNPEAMHAWRAIADPIIAAADALEAHAGEPFEQKVERALMAFQTSKQEGNTDHRALMDALRAAGVL